MSHPDLWTFFATEASCASWRQVVVCALQKRCYEMRRGATNSRVPNGQWLMRKPDANNQVEAK
jgi:hypothetical protein